MIPATSELIGLNNFGLMSVANPLGTMLFFEELTGRLYDNEDACVLLECFLVPFVMLSECCALGTVVSLILSARIQPLHRALYHDGLFRLTNNTQLLMGVSIMCASASGL
jgi:hypothetical protein